MKKRIFAAILALMTVACLLPAAAEATPQPEVTYTDCIKFSSETSFGLQVSGGKGWDGTLEYSHDHSTWTPWDGTVIENSNGKIYLRGTDNSVITGGSGPWILDGYGEITCTGNIENLLDYAEVAVGNHPAMGDFCYTSMFKNCEHLISAPELPATTLAECCYDCMFADCTGLILAPALPATTLEPGCYQGMFSGCTGLTAAPVLNAAAMKSRCYCGMFSSCISLQKAPALAATVLAESCYANMFSDCTGLTTPPMLPATTLASSCYFSMFYGCTSLTAPPTLPATTLAAQCYGYMFDDCTGIKLSSTIGNGYGIKWRIPATGTVTTAPTGWSERMLQGTGGTFRGSPAINTTYYLYGVAKYTVTHNLTNLTATEDTAGADKADTGTGYATVLTADNGYVLPQTIAVTIDGEAAAAGTDYTYSSSTGTVTVTAAKVTGDIVITAAGVSATYTATVTPDGKSFGSETVGYSPITAATFTIESTGTGALGDLSVALTGGSAGSFTLDSTGTATALDASGGTAASTTFTVKPNDGLAVGDYTATVEVTASNLTKITKTVSFSVTAAAPSSGGDPYFRTVTVYNDYQTPGKAVYLTGRGLTEEDELITERLSSSKVYDRLKKLAGGANVWGVYNVSLKSGQLVYSRSPLTLHFNLENEYAHREFTLIHEKADGTLEYIYATSDLVGDLHFYPIYDFSPSFMLVEGTVKP